jgi:integration host factor subunit beta
LTKSELTALISPVIELPLKDSEAVVEAILDSIVRALRKGDKVEVRGFGSFGTRERKARVGWNPKTGARVDVPAKRVPFFRPSRELKDLVMVAPPKEGDERTAS